MKKKIDFVLIVVILFGLFSNAEVIDKKIINPKKNYTIGDIIEYRIKIKTESDRIKIKEEKIKDIEIVKEHEKKDGKNLTIYRKYQLFNIDIKKLPDIILENEKGEKHIIAGVKIKMSSVLTPKDKKLEDIIPPIKGLNTGYSPVPLIIGFILLTILIILLYLLYKKIKKYRKKDEIPEKIWEKKIDPIEYLEAEWGKIDINNYLKKGKEKELFYDLSEILKIFLSLYYKKNYIDMTSYELITEFKKEPHSELSNDISTFLEQADLIKFAKKVPEKNKEINYAISFFNKLIEYYKRLKERNGLKSDIDHNN